MEVTYHLNAAPTLLQEAEEQQSRILDADYSKVDITEYVMGLKQLDPGQKDKLAKMLNKHTELFAGGLGTLNIKPIHLDLVDSAKPYHSQAFPFPKSLERTMKVEME